MREWVSLSHNFHRVKIFQHWWCVESLGFLCSASVRPVKYWFRDFSSSSRQIGKLILIIIPVHMFDRIAFWSEALHRTEKNWDHVLSLKLCFCLQLFLQQQRSRLNATFAPITFCMSSGRIIMAGHRSCSCCCCHCYYNKWTERNRKRQFCPCFAVENCTPIKY